MDVVTYGTGGYNTGKPANNVTSTVTIADNPWLVNADTIRARAVQALADNRTYIAIASPSAAQSTAQVKALTKQVDGLIRLVLGVFDATDDT